MVFDIQLILLSFRQTVAERSAENALFIIVFEMKRFVIVYDS